MESQEEFWEYTLLGGWLPLTDIKGDEDKDYQFICLSLTQAVWTEGLRQWSPRTGHRPDISVAAF